MPDPAGPLAPPPSRGDRPPLCPCGESHDPADAKAELLPTGVLVSELLADQTGVWAGEPNVL